MEDHCYTVAIDNGQIDRRHTHSRINDSEIIGAEVLAPWAVISFLTELFHIELMKIHGTEVSFNQVVTNMDILKINSPGH